jgi:hypothetical protein
MECEENLGLGTVDRSELQVLTGVGITVIPWAFVKDRRMAARRGITHTAPFTFFTTLATAPLRMRVPRLVTNISNLDCP